MALKPTTKTLRADFRKYMTELGLHPPKKATNSALTSNELTTNSDLPGETLKALSESLLTSISQLKKKSEQLYLFAVLQFENGLRASELINLRCTDITVTGGFKIRGKKGSNNRMISGGIAKDYLLQCRQIGRNPFIEFDRFFLRREYIKVGINFHQSGDKRAKVTHIFRHLMVSGMLQSGIEVEEAARFIGHKNSKNTEHYGKIN